MFGVTILTWVYWRLWILTTVCMHAIVVAPRSACVLFCNFYCDANTPSALGGVGGSGAESAVLRTTASHLRSVAQKTMGEILAATTTAVTTAGFTPPSTALVSPSPTVAAISSAATAVTNAATSVVSAASAAAATHCKDSHWISRHVEWLERSVWLIPIFALFCLHVIWIRELVLKGLRELRGS